MKILEKTAKLLKIVNLKHRIWIFISLAFLLFTRIYFISSTPELTISGALEEQLYTLVAAKNLNEYGWLKTNGLPDYVTSNDPNDHAVVYTHFPSLPNFLAALFLKYSSDYKIFRCFYAFINFFGWVLAGIVICKKLKTNYYSIFYFSIAGLSSFLLWCDHFEYAFFPLLVFSPWLFIPFDTNKTKNQYLFFGLIFVTSIFNYKILCVQISGLLMYILFNAESSKKEKVNSIICLLCACFSGFVLHIIQNIKYLGFSVAITEILFSISNRIFGNPKIEEIINFFSSNNIVCWGVQTDVSLTQKISTFTGILKTQTDIFKKIYPIYLWPVIFCCVIFCRWNKSKCAFLLAIFSGSISWAILFPAHAAGYGLPPSINLAAVVAALMFWKIYNIFANKSQYFISFKNKNLFLVIVFCLQILPFCHFFYRSSKSIFEIKNIVKMEKEENVFEELSYFRNYQDKVIWTNVSAVFISFFCNTPVVGRLTNNEILEQNISKARNFLINSRANKDKYNHPDLIVISNQLKSGGMKEFSAEEYFNLKQQLEKKSYEIIEKKRFTVFFLTKKN